MKYLVLLIYIVAIATIGYLPKQGDFPLIFTSFSLAFASYFLLIAKLEFKVRHLLFVAIGLRILLIFAYPNLSDDIYRFIWDGRLLHSGANPFAYLPSEYQLENQNAYLDTIFPLLNSQDYYSVYPPFAQLVFYVATIPGLDNPYWSALVVKLLLLCAEILTVLFSLKTLSILKLPSRRILWYALNPLAIIEIMANVHFEGFMICFFALFLYFLVQNKDRISAVFIGFSIATKLVPLLFLPYFLFQWKFKRAMYFFGIIGILLLVMFSPVAFQLSAFGDSLDLYFRKFEFNASIYYLFRALGNWIYGYNYISIIGPTLGLTVFISVIARAIKSRLGFIEFTRFAMIALTVYLLLSTTVHPWYTCLGVLLSIYSGRRYFMVWSYLVVLSYAKYWGSDLNYYLCVSIEYLSLGAFMIWETMQLDKVRKAIS